MSRPRANMRSVLALALLCFTSGFAPPLDTHRPRKSCALTPSALLRHPAPRCSVEPTVPEPASKDVPGNTLPGAGFLARNIESPKVELFNAASSFSWFIIYAMLSLKGLAPEARGFLQGVEEVIAIGFALEYLMRWYSRGLDPRHVVQPIIVLDLLSFAPTLLHLVLPVIAGLALEYLGMSNDPTLVVLYGQAYRFFDFGGGGNDFIVLRFVRLVQLQRFLKDNEAFSKLQLELGLEPMAVKQWQLLLVRASSSIFFLLFIASGFMYETEPKVTSYFQALYYGLQTLVNGADSLIPETIGGRAVVSGTVLAGIAIIPVQIADLAKAYFTREEEEKDTCAFPDELDEPKPAEPRGLFVKPDDVQQWGYFTPKVTKPTEQPPIPVAQLEAQRQADLIGRLEASIVRLEARLVAADGKVAGVACGTCGAAGHRADAAFCYRCSSPLVAEATVKGTTGTASRWAGGDGPTTY